MLRLFFVGLAFLAMLIQPAPVLAVQKANTPAKGTPNDALRLLYFSSYPEIIQAADKPGLGQLATVIQTEKTQNPDTYFIFGGASLGPSLLGALDKGAHLIDILNGLEPEFMAVMKREFAYGMNQLVINAYASAFPMVTSNLVLADDARPIEGLEPYFLLEGMDMSVGFIVLTSKNAIHEYGAVETRALDATHAVQQTAAELRAMGANAIFIMADTDYDDLSTYRQQGMIDGIFYTHNFDNPQSLDLQGTLVTEGALDGVVLAVDLWLDEGGTLHSQASQLLLSDYDANPQTASLVASYQERLQERLSPPIATLASSFDTLRENVRTGENPFGNFVADAARSYLDTDVFLLNSGAIRGNRRYESGSTINRGDIQRELPFGNRTAVLSMSGATLKQVLEYGLECSASADGCALQVSNLKVRYDSTAVASQRISEIQVDDMPLEDERTYTVGMSDFMAAGNDGFDMLKGATPVAQAGTGRALWDLIAEYCAARESIAPSHDGRLTDTSKDH